ncbi:centrosomal protein CEP57L1 isoform X2 [Ascaphus truei]|uniref:centrosomal protein CEP57L1 isoform X2 n=1 Tax=Ascaphus truei TaxID=8439 RepID=UPI003F594539
MDSMLKDSYLGSFYQPPNSIPMANFIDSKSSPTRKMPSFATKHSNPNSYDVLQAPNSKALVSALKTLQEKICHLELERTRAHSNLQNLTKEAAEYLDSEREGKDPAQPEIIRPTHDVTTQLNVAQQRCSLLEKQLDYMRNMVQNAELERNVVLGQQTLLRQENIQDQMQVHCKLEKLDVLEKECVRLTATQRNAENKIHQLEEKLCAEEQQRKLIQDKAAQLQTGLEVNRILISSASAQIAPKRKVKKKNPQTKKSVVNKEPLQHQCYPKARELPFVAGRSTSSSHSLSANMQSVLHMMKHHSPRVSQPCLRSAERKPWRPQSASRSVATCSASSATGDNLSDLLLALQDELGQMSFEHQELLKQIHETKNNEICEDLERELDYLVKQMETKSDQILTLKGHQESVVKLKKRAQSMKKLASSAKSAAHEERGNTEVLATPRSARGDVTKSTATPKGRSSLQLLKNVQKMQMTLKKDDIMWEK